MKVICKINNLNDIYNSRLYERLRKYILMPDGEVSLEIGKEYTVYGVVFWDNSPWYYLCSEEDDEYPTPYAADFFHVTDKRLSKYWTLSTTDQGLGEILSSLVINDWANDPYFYERLIENDVDIMELFDKYRQLMDKEYN